MRFIRNLYRDEVSSVGLEKTVTALEGLEEVKTSASPGQPAAAALIKKTYGLFYRRKGICNLFSHSQFLQRSNHSFFLLVIFNRHISFHLFRPGSRIIRFQSTENNRFHPKKWGEVSRSLQDKITLAHSEGNISQIYNIIFHSFQHHFLELLEIHIHSSILTHTIRTHSFLYWDLLELLKHSLKNCCFLFIFMIDYPDNHSSIF